MVMLTSQNYLGFKPSIEGSQEEKVHQLGNCILEIHIWMQDNLLKLNDEKTEFLILETLHQVTLINDISIKVVDTHVNKLTSTLYL